MTRAPTSTDSGTTDQAAPRAYTFERFELQPAERRLLVDGEPAAVAPHAFDVLVTLVERAGRLVTKDELLDLVWPDVVVEENNLQVQVSALRKLLGPAAIATVQGRGYRFTLAPQRVTAELPSSVEVRNHNLPRQLTSFIGREKEIVEIGKLLGRTQLLTLTGAGGCGKTRLSLEVAAASRERFPDGAWFVEFAPLADAGLVPHTVATVLGVREETGKPITRALTRHLEHKRLLLLLDNCEHVLDACVTTADTLMRKCPDVKILATSRETLGIAGEQTYRVPSLAMPDRKSVHSAQTLSTYESVQLFIDRALQVRPDFRITNHNASTLASLCCHLDGIPLAIELAAARVRSVAVDEIEGKLDERFRLLTGGSRTALPRQQTLRSLIDWSYDLLSGPEQRLLQRLSVFTGGWTLNAAGKVCAGDDVPNWEVLDLLTSLCDKSLVMVDQNDGRYRYRLLETVRQYASEKLAESGGSDTLRERHRDYFLLLAEEAEANLKGAAQAEWLERLEGEHENLRAGLQWSLVDAKSTGGLRLCGALQHFWLTRGHFSEGRAWSMRVLEQPGSQVRTRERAKAVYVASVLALRQADYPTAVALYEESLALRRELGDREGIAATLDGLGNAAYQQGDYRTAKKLFEEALAIRRTMGDKSGIAASLNNLGLVASEGSDLATARALFEESLAIRRELGDRGSIASSLNNLAIVASHQDFALAQSLFQESLALQRQLGDKRGIAYLLSNLGDMARQQGHVASARVLYQESLAIVRELGDRRGIANSLSCLGMVAHDQGDYLAAVALYREGLAIRREIGDKRGIAVSLVGLAATIAALGGLIRAARVLGAADALRKEIGSLGPHNEERVAAARAALGDDIAFGGAWQEGRSLTLEQAIELALENTIVHP